MAISGRVIRWWWLWWYLLPSPTVREMEVCQFRMPGSRTSLRRCRLVCHVVYTLVPSEQHWNNARLMDAVPAKYYLINVLLHRWRTFIWVWNLNSFIPWRDLPHFFMHPRNPYRNPPDFHQLAADYPPLLEQWVFFYQYLRDWAINHNKSHNRFCPSSSNHWFSWWRSSKVWYP